MVVIFHSYSIQYHIWLVVSTYPSEKHEFVSWDYMIPNIWENKKGSKPPTSMTYDIPINRTNGFVTDLTSSAILNSDLSDRWGCRVYPDCETMAMNLATSCKHASPAPCSFGWDFPWFQRGSIIQSTPMCLWKSLLIFYHPHHHHPPHPPIFDGNLPRTNFSFSQNTSLLWHLLALPLRSPGQSAGSSAGSKWCLGYHPLGGTC